MKYSIESVKDNNNGKIRIRVELDKKRHRDIWLSEKDAKARNSTFGAFIDIELFPEKFRDMDRNARARDEALSKEITESQEENLVG
jgi:hypothetical protein